MLEHFGNDQFLEPGLPTIAFGEGGFLVLRSVPSSWFLGPCIFTRLIPVSFQAPGTRYQELAFRYQALLFNHNSYSGTNDFKL
jgi:hypothetical protein